MSDSDLRTGLRAIIASEGIEGLLNLLMGLLNADGAKAMPGLIQVWWSLPKPNLPSDMSFIDKIKAKSQEIAKQQEVEQAKRDAERAADFDNRIMADVGPAFNYALTRIENAANEGKRNVTWECSNYTKVCEIIGTQLREIGFRIIIENGCVTAQW
jgi:hypothetical protein